MAEANGSPPTPVLETVDDRLRRLEQALDRLSGPGGGPAGLMPPALLAAVVPADAAGGVWGRVPVLRELRLMLGMYFDPRYRLSRPGQLGIPAVLGLMLLNYFFFNAIIGFPLLPFVGGVFERLFLIVLAVVLYKLLSREAARYEAVLRYLSQYAR
jgi:hypothetical protein